jgi:hypothetical protein
MCHNPVLSQLSCHGCAAIIFPSRLCCHGYPVMAVYHYLCPMTAILTRQSRQARLATLHCSVGGGGEKAAASFPGYAHFNSNPMIISDLSKDLFLFTIIYTSELCVRKGIWYRYHEFTCAHAVSSGVSKPARTRQPAPKS